VDSVEREQLVRECRTIGLFVNVRLDILEVHTLNVVPSVTEIVIVQDLNQLASMAFVKILVMVHVEPTLIVT
jgi:hypothetical protein